MEKKTTTFYKTGSYMTMIEQVETTRHNDKSVWIYNEYRQKEVRSSRRSTYDNYWRTFDEAKEFLISQVNSKINNLNEEIERQKNRLSKIFECKPNN